MDEIANPPSPDLSLATLLVLEYALEPEISVEHATSVLRILRLSALLH